MKHESDGFTVIELLIVMTVLALAVGIAAANFQGGMAGARLKSEVRHLVALMYQTRAKAMTEGVTIGVFPGEHPNSILIGPDGDAADLPPNFSLVLNLDSTAAAANRPGLFFYPDGSSSGGSLTVQSTEREANITVSWLTGEIAVVESSQE